MTTSAPLPTYFLSHGGGPWPYMSGRFRENFRQLEASLHDLPRQIGGRPQAVLVISGHWEAPVFKAMASPAPTMVYDYSGFPPETYAVKYPAPGAPELAARVQTLLQGAGLPAELDLAQGYDHGTFAPMAVIYPNADVPVLQLSLRNDLDPAEHLAAGRALAPLRRDKVLILGSGLSYHNLRELGPGAQSASSEFDAWLQQTLVGSSSAERTQRLIDWRQAPSARAAHPREDHLLPLMVAVGAAENEPATCVYHQDDFFGGTVVSSFRFGAAIAGPAAAV